MSYREKPLMIPRDNVDLRAYVRKKRLAIWLKTVGWEAFWIAVFAYYHSRMDMVFDYRFSLVLSALLIFGLFAFGWVNMMFDHSYRGRIVRIDYKQVMEMSPSGRGTSRVRSVQKIHLRVEDEAGHKHKIVLPKKNGFDRYYHVGDTIIHYSGLPYPESNDGADKNLFVCSLCGGVELTDTDRCHGCGASLIKPVKSRFAKS
jgi:hypothetical protein